MYPIQASKAVQPRRSTSAAARAPGLAAVARRGEASRRSRDAMRSVMLMSFREGEAAQGWECEPRPVRPGLVLRVHARQLWSADEVGGYCAQQERAGPGPPGGRGGRDDDAGAGWSLDQAGDLLVVVAADPGDV